MKLYRVTLYATTGERVKSIDRPSKYAAKRLARFWRAEYGASYQVVVEVVE